MSYSLKFNNIELNLYGLTVALSSSALAALLSSDMAQLADRVYAPSSLAPAKTLLLPVVVQADTSAQLFSYLDSIKRICGQKEAGQLILNIQTDRYYTARFESFVGRRASPLVFEGEMKFIADDPLAYAVSMVTSGPHTIPDAEETFEVVVSLGTAYIKPTYTLTAGDALTDITLLGENTDTDEEFSWTGSVGSGKDFVINVGTMYATNDGATAMAGLNTGNQFPRLIPGTTNHIKVSDFWNAVAGSLTIVYRPAYL